jgi:hypothetical protein
VMIEPRGVWRAWRVMGCGLVSTYMWCKGIIFRHRDDELSATLSIVNTAPAKRLYAVIGTSFFLPLVPLVKRRTATSSALLFSDITVTSGVNVSSLVDDTVNVRSGCGWTIKTGRTDSSWTFGASLSSMRIASAFTASTSARSWSGATVRAMGIMVYRFAIARTASARMGPLGSMTATRGPPCVGHGRPRSKVRMNSCSLV